MNTPLPKTAVQVVRAQHRGSIMDLPTVSQVGGTHYASGYIHWDFVTDVQMGYLYGNLTKYLSRWRKKNGLQDLEKALSYARKMTESVERGRVHPVRLPQGTFTRAVTRFCRANRMHPCEERLVDLCTHWKDIYDVRMVEELMETMVQDVTAALPSNGYVNQDR